MGRVPAGEGLALFSDMNDESKPFTVKDRRHFTPEGEARESSAKPEATPEQRPPVAAPQDTRSESESDPLAEDAPATLTGFLAGLAAQAGLLLGLTAAPGQEPLPPDLRGARHIISLLEMLKDKTDGNRTAEESQVIDAVLYELRMAFVQVAEKEGS